MSRLSSGPIHVLKMLVANEDARTKLHYDSEEAGGWVRTARVVADVFLERFFATVRAYDARFDDYLWHWPTIPFYGCRPVDDNIPLP